MTDRIEAAARAMWARTEDEVTFDEAKAANDAAYQWTMEDARLAIEAADATGHSSPVTLTYTNWRGETADRTIIPLHIWFGTTEWHPEAQWLLRAIDVEKNAERDFALKDFGTHPSAQRDDLIAEIERLRAERNDADRRAGAAERWLEQRNGTISKAADWRNGWKEKLGYDRNVSFDKVWADVLEKAGGIEGARLNPSEEGR